MLNQQNHSTETSTSRFRLFSPTVLISRRWWLSTLLVLFGIVMLARLGFWQLNRLAQRRAWNTEVSHQLALPPLPLSGDTPLPDDLTTLKTRRATAQGNFDFSHQMALVYQNREGVPGLHLIAPLLIEGDSKAVLVDRGWIPQTEAAPEQWGQFDEAGSVTVTGFMQLSQTLPNATSLSNATPPSPAATPQTDWFRVDISAIQTQLPYELLPIYIRQSPTETNPDSLPYKVDPQFDLSDGSHLGYAIQWFTFALVFGIIYIIFVGKTVDKG